MTIKEKLLDWATKTFGVDVSMADQFSLYEEIGINKKKENIVKLILFVKKHKGYKKDWIEIECFSKWIEEIEKILIGATGIKMFSAEAKEIIFGFDGKTKGITDRFDYKFNLEVYLPSIEAEND